MTKSQYDFPVLVSLISTPMSFAQWLANRGFRIGVFTSGFDLRHSFVIGYFDIRHGP